MVAGSHLVFMTSLQQHTTAPAADVPVRASALGAGLAASSRRAQGLATAVDDPAVLAELRDLCSLPRPAPRADPARRSG